MFAKQPRPGRVKTRLCPPLSLTEAADLYRRLLDETLAHLQQGAGAVVLCYDGERDWFADRYPGLPLLPQVQADLGERLWQATAQLFAAGAGPLLLLGSDSPDLPLAWIDEAIAQLQNVDVVTIPCIDGGYALLGQKQPTPELFAGIPWSSAEVLNRTRQNAEAAGLSFAEIGQWDDLDDWPALLRLLVRAPDSEIGQYLRTQLVHHLDAVTAG